jgi:transposase
VYKSSSQNFFHLISKLIFGSWTQKKIIELVRNKFNKQRLKRTIGDYLKKWYFSPQRPAKRAIQRDLAKGTNFLKEEVQEPK